MECLYMLDEFIRYELPVSDQSRDKPPQPTCILLESQLENLKHHFVHWNLSGLTPTVKCQVSKREIWSVLYSHNEFCYSNCKVMILMGHALMWRTILIRDLCGWFQFKVARHNFHCNHLADLIILHLKVMAKQLFIKAIHQISKIMTYLDSTPSK